MLGVDITIQCKFKQKSCLIHFYYKILQTNKCCLIKKFVNYSDYYLPFIHYLISIY